MPITPNDNQLPVPKSTTVLRRDTTSSCSVSPSSVLPPIRSPSVVTHSPPQLSEVKLGPLRQEIQALKSAVETDRKKTASQQQVISQLGELAQFTGAEALLNRIAQLELDNAKLRAATLLPPSPSPAGNRPDYTISPAKILLESTRVATPPPERSPSRVLDMGAPLSPDTPDFTQHDAPPAHPSMLPRPRTPTSISPSTAPPPPPPPLPVPTLERELREPARTTDLPIEIPESPEFVEADEPENTDAHRALCAVSADPTRTSTSPVDIVDYDTEAQEGGKAAIGSILSRMFGGADVTLVETGVATSQEAPAVFPTMQQPLFAEEKWVPRGMYPVMKLADVARPGTPLPDVRSMQFEILLESGNLYKYESGDITGLYNSSPDKQFTLSFVIPSPSVIPVGDCKRSGTTFIVKLEPGEAKPFVRGVIDGYKVTVQYGKPGSSFLKRRIEEQETSSLVPRGTAKECAERGLAFVDKAFPPSSDSLCRKWEGTTTRRCWLRLQDVYCGAEVGLFVAPVQPNTIKLTNLSDVHSISALAVLAEHPYLVKKIFTRVPEESAGAYQLRVFNGTAQPDTTVDAFFPFLGYSLAFAAHLTHPHELWVPLVHKAYTKLKGSYVAARDGTVAEVLSAFTGLPVDMLDVGTRGNVEAAFERLQTACDAGCVCALVTPRHETLAKQQRASGLLGGCGYAVTRVAQVSGRMLVQLRNPWLNPRLWNGKWGHSSALWDDYPQVVSQLNMTFEDDGCMWLEMDEVNAWFTGLVVVNNKAWGRVCADVQLSGGVPNYVLQVDVQKATRVHLAAVAHSDNGRASAGVAVMTAKSSTWVRDPWVDVVPGMHWFVVTGHDGGAHIVLHALCELGDATFLKPSSELRDLLYKGCTELSLPECSPVDSDCPIRTRVQVSTAEGSLVTTVTSSTRF